MSRQAPASKEPCYLVIGNGRLAKHFCHYLTLLQQPFLSWSRTAGTSLTPLLKQSTQVLLLITDSAIEPFIREHADLTEKTCLHCSGSLLTDLAYGAHPLMSFGPDLYTLAEYRRIPWVIEAEGPAFSELLPRLNNPHFAIPRDQKAYYHALCVMSNNFTTLLWKKFFNAMHEQFHIPKQHLLPLLQRTLHNLANNHNTALTGPLARADQKTIDSNISALEGDAFQSIYTAFAALMEEKQYEH